MTDYVERARSGFSRGEPENLTADQFSEIRSDRP